jgi:hypothetical protein
MGISPVVRKDELLAILQENRAKHRRVFEAAVEGWSAEVSRQLDAAKQRILQGKRQNVYISLPVPKDHTRDYDRAIRSVTMHVENTIRLSDTDMAQYVEDDWSWRREFTASALRVCQRGVRRGVRGRHRR